MCIRDSPASRLVQPVAPLPALRHAKSSGLQAVRPLYSRLVGWASPHERIGRRFARIHGECIGLCHTRRTRSYIMQPWRVCVSDGPLSSSVHYILHARCMAGAKRFIIELTVNKRQLAYIASYWITSPVEIAKSLHATATFLSILFDQGLYILHRPTSASNAYRVVVVLYIHIASELRSSRAQSTNSRFQVHAREHNREIDKKSRRLSRAVRSSTSIAHLLADHVTRDVVGDVSS